MPVSESVSVRPNRRGMASMVTLSGSACIGAYVAFGHSHSMLARIALAYIGGAACGMLALLALWYERRGPSIEVSNSGVKIRRFFGRTFSCRWDQVERIAGGSTSRRPALLPKERGGYSFMDSVLPGWDVQLTLCLKSGRRITISFSMSQMPLDRLGEIMARHMDSSSSPG
jgi:hypothetical protein